MNILYLGKVYQIEVCNLHYSVIMLALCFYAKINHCAQNDAGIYSIILTIQIPILTFHHHLCCNFHCNFLRVLCTQQSPMRLQIGADREDVVS